MIVIAEEVGLNLGIWIYRLQRQCVGVAALDPENIALSGQSFILDGAEEVAQAVQICAYSLVFGCVAKVSGSVVVSDIGSMAFNAVFFGIFEVKTFFVPAERNLRAIETGDVLHVGGNVRSVRGSAGVLTGDGDGVATLES